MKKLFILTIAIVSIVIFPAAQIFSGNNPVSITVLFDNYSTSNDLQADFGFSCLIEGTVKNILFDTGRAKDVFFENFKKMNHDLNDIEQIVISHNHSDHTANLFNILAVNNKATVYLPASFPEPFVEKVRATSAQVVYVKNSMKLNADSLLTGELRNKGIHEQSLIVKTSKGAVVIVGCSHPGIVNIIRQAKKLTKSEIQMVIGGFHMARSSEDDVKLVIDQLQELGVKKIAPSHCTGEKTRTLIKKAFGDNFIQVGAGTKLIF